MSASPGAVKKKPPPLRRGLRSRADRNTYEAGLLSLCEPSMNILLWTLSLLLGAVLLAALARRIKVPSPSLLAMGGVLVALIPDGPRISREPDLALALFVAPVLMDAAFNNSLRDLRENWIPVTSLVFMAVAVTIAAVAIVARWFVPAMPWPVAVALGAAVAPPDAAAATAVLKEVQLPHRLVAILEERGCSTTRVHCSSTDWP